MRLLVMCSSFRRPKYLKKMLESFDKTQKMSDIVIYLHEDDPTLEEYKLIIKGRNFEIGPHKTMVEVDNYFIKKYPNYDFYQNINDDHVYIKKGWDKKMTNNLGERIAYCVQDGDLFEHPTAEIVPKAIIKKLGYYIYPAFSQYGCDTYMKKILEIVGGARYDGFILHKCANLGLMDKDENWNDIYHRKSVEKGDAALQEFINKGELNKLK